MSAERKMSDASLANLKPFQKGDERINRAGRPKNVFSAGLRKVLEGREEGSDETVADEINRLAADIARGKVQASATQVRMIEMLMDRMEGRARQSISLDTDEHSRLERKLQNYLGELEREGDPMTRGEAIAVLAEEDARFEGFE
jgi:hypothetical protein